MNALAGQRAPDFPDGAVPAGLAPGVHYRYYEVNGDFVALNSFITPSKLGVVNSTGTPIYPAPNNATNNSSFDLTQRTRDDNIGFRWTGYIHVTAAGSHIFYTSSDDGSRLYIGNQLVVNNDGGHGIQQQQGTIDLAAGYHELTLLFKQGGGGWGVGLAWNGPSNGNVQTAVPNTSMFTQSNTAAHAKPTLTLNPTTGVMAPTATVTVSNLPAGAKIYYTLDGTYPLMGNPTTLESTNATININVAPTSFRAVIRGGLLQESDVSDLAFFDTLRTADTPTGTVQGLYYRYYNFAGGLIPANIATFWPNKSGRMDNITDANIAAARLAPDNYLFRWTGFIQVPTDGMYTFFTSSDDSSNVYVGDRLVASNNVAPTNLERSGMIGLRAGRHAITVDHGNGTGGTGMSVSYQGPGIAKTVIPNGVLSALPNVADITASPAPGNFTGSVTVTLATPTPNAVIYYSTDGSDPSPTRATGVYTAPLQFTQTTTLKAVSFINGQNFGYLPVSVYTRSDTSPTVITALASGINNSVLVYFDSAVAAPAANLASNYSIVQVGGGALAVNSAVLDAQDPKLVRLTTAAMPDNAKYVLTVSNLASAPNNSVPFKYYPKGTATRERFDAVPNGSIAGLLGSASFTGNTPAVVDFRNLFEIPVDAAEAYGTRIRAFYYPPSTNTFRFYIACDDQSQFFLAPDDNLNNKPATTLVNLSNWCPSRAWLTAPTNAADVKSATAVLDDTRRYFIEGLMAEGGGGDNFAVLGVLEGTVVANNDSPILGANMSPIVFSPRIPAQPKPVVGLQGNNVSLSVGAAGTGILLYQWQKDGVDVATGGTAATLTFNPAQASDSGKYRCRVTNDAGEVFSIEVDVNIINPATPPTVTNVNPNIGPDIGGQAVTITGTGFVAGSTVVSFGGTAATNVVVTSSTTLTCVTPAHTAGVVTVSVQVFGQTPGTLTNAYTFVPTPQITSIVPAVGPLAGEAGVVINGVNFTPGATVTVGGAAATITNSTATAITITTPARPAGAATVTVTTPGGSVNSTYTYVPFPTVTNVTPVQGPLTGGATATITGSNFIAGRTTVDFGGSPATNVTVVGPTSLTCTVPAHAAGSVVISVTTFGVQTTSLNAPLFEYVPAATLSAFSPNVGTAGGGTVVTFTGAGFPQDLTQIGVTLAGVPANVISVNAAGTSLVVTTGATAAASLSGPAIVTTYGTQPSTPFGTFSYIPVPSFGSQPTLTPNPALAGQLVLASASEGFGGTIQWDWGDGSSTTGNAVSHVWNSTGVYTVTITALSQIGEPLVQTLQIFVALGLEGDAGNGTGGGATPPGVTGILVGGDGAGSAQGGSGKVTCNYVRREKTMYQGSLASLALPAGLTQADLVNMPGNLIIGKGAKTASFRFDLDKRGKGKATGLPRIEFSVKKRSIKFKAQRTDLTEVTEALGAPQEFGVKKGQQVTLMVPVTVQIGTKIFIAMTFQLKYQQINTGGKGGLMK